MLVKLIRNSDVERFSGWHWNSGAPVCCAPTVPPRRRVSAQRSATQWREKSHFSAFIPSINLCLSHCFQLLPCKRLFVLYLFHCQRLQHWHAGSQEGMLISVHVVPGKKGIIITTTKKHLGSCHSPLLPTEWLHAPCLGRVPQKLTY